MRAIPLALAIIAALLGAHTASAQDLSRAKPEDLGFSSERLERITKIFREDAAHGKSPGFVLLIARHGKLGYYEAIGALNPETNAPMTGDTIFRIYSMNRPITKVAAMVVYEAGRIALDEPIAQYLPLFKEIQVGIEKAG